MKTDTTAVGVEQRIGQKVIQIDQDSYRHNQPGLFPHGFKAQARHHAGHGKVKKNMNKRSNLKQAYSPIRFNSVGEVMPTPSIRSAGLGPGFNNRAIRNLLSFISSIIQSFGKIRIVNVYSQKIIIN